MAYLVVFMVNNAPYEYGDVISWRPEGSQSFGIGMLAHPWFRVVRCSDMSDAVAESLVTPQQGDRKLNPMLKERAFGVNYDVLPNPNTAKLKGAKAAMSTKWDGTKYLTPEDISITSQALLNARFTKPIITAAVG